MILKLKTFDVFDMLDGINLEKSFEIMREIAPFCLYAPERHTMGICLIENKESILDIIRRHGEALGLKVRVQGHFVNLSTGLTGDKVDWDDILVGNHLLNSDDFWNEVVEVVTAREDELISSTNFSEEWRIIKITAVKTVIDKWHEVRKKELEEEYNAVTLIWSDMENVPLF